ncbi:MAG: hypothetical protein A4E53_00891 [Pelotomaculum sp. PtaB.Bin104]|nr:MAG: hypothetical protein A4E53_00891 [Pelotomaculum sp. PtaB.Bin104]
MKEPEVLVYMWNKRTGKFDIPVTMKQIIAARERKSSAAAWYKAASADSAADVEFIRRPRYLRRPERKTACLAEINDQGGYLK